jgi:long-chain acyl-CoA synthetase
MLLLKKIQHFSRSIPDKEALVSATKSICYAELAELVENGAAWLYQHGIKQGDTVGLVISDEIEHLLASLSLLALGVRQITLATHESLDVHRTLIMRANLNYIITNRAYPEINQIDDVSYIYWSSAQKSTLDFYSLDLHNSEGILYINTTGTTAKSNIILFTETQIGQQALRHIDYTNERLLRLAPVEFNTSKRHRLYSLWNGGCNVFRPTGDLQEVVTFAHDYGVTCLDVSRMHIYELCSIPKLQHLKGIKVRPGGAEVPLALRKKFVNVVPSLLYVRYATTETGAIAMAGPTDHIDNASCGKVLPGVVLQIVNDSGEELPPNTIGEIRVRTPGMATGYLDNPQQTSHRFHDGWFYPGDTGCIKADGQLLVYGRKDDMIILNGINIFPSEIEIVLESHPAVANAIAVALTSQIHGQIPVAAVQLKQGNSTNVDELMIYAREKLVLRYPRRILILDTLPRNKQGKLLRQEVRALFEQNN